MDRAKDVTLENDVRGMAGAAQQSYAEGAFLILAIVALLPVVGAVPEIVSRAAGS